jgi:hypothetical protein
MKACLYTPLISTLLAGGAAAFTIASEKNRAMRNMPLLKALPEKIEVCGFKDCRRAGGGAKLEKLVNTVCTNVHME